MAALLQKHHSGATGGSNCHRLVIDAVPQRMSRPSLLRGNDR